MRPILVTGSHRSGTTWAGRMLCAAPGTAYLHEPFNPVVYPLLLGRPMPHWFEQLDEANGEEWRDAVARMLGFRFPVRANLSRAKGPLDLARIARAQGRALAARLSDARPVMKDPIAFFSAEWLAATFGMEVLVTIRHPAAFTSSVLLKGWRFDFANFRDQPRLIDGLLAAYSAEIEEAAARPPEMVDHAVLLWNCIHHVAASYRDAHPDWQFARHEDLSLDPLGGFRGLYAAFGFDFTPKVEAALRKSTGAHNPAEQAKGREFARDARANVDNWKRRLEPGDIARIRDGTAAVATHFYSDADW